MISLPTTSALNTISLFVYEEISVSESYRLSFILGLLVAEAETKGVAMEDYKRALGPLASTLSEAEIQHLYELSDRLAGALFDMWRDKCSNAVK